MLSLVGIAVIGMTARAAGQAADSVLSLLPGVDEERLAAAAEIWGDPPSREATEAAAKLLWAISRIDPAVLTKLAPQAADESPPPAAGLAEQLRVVPVRGTVERLDAVRIPPELAEVLEFERLYRVWVQRDISAAASGLPATVRVVTREVPAAWLSATRGAGDGAAGVGQTVEFTAVGVGSGPATRLYASRLRWYPQVSGPDGNAGGNAGAGGDSLPVGWRMLAAEGVDIGRLADVAARNRQSLSAEDSEAFYGMLAAAAAYSEEASEGERPVPVRVRTLQMLRAPADLVGHWIRLDVETVRLSRIAVTSPERRAQLGRDAYWQIDAFGELRGAKVQLESPEPGGEPLLFENRFPVSLAILDLPEWLSRKVHSEAGGADSEGRVAVSMLTEPVTVEGFFFRLWSYDTEYAASRGGRQIGPLIVATELHQPAPNVAMQRGVAAIGWILAATVIASMVIAALVLWRVGRKDRAAARARRNAATKLPETPEGPW